MRVTENRRVADCETFYANGLVMGAKLTANNIASQQADCGVSRVKSDLDVFARRNRVFDRLKTRLRR
jgi:hypothetical protein